MTERERMIKQHQAAIDCLNEVTEDHIGQMVMVRDYIDEEWIGPYQLVSINDAEFPFIVKNTESSFPKYTFATVKIPPRCPLDIELIPWEGGECPVEDGQRTIIMEGDGTVAMISSSSGLERQWKHEDSPSFNIVAYLPLNIRVQDEAHA